MLMRNAGHRFDAEPAVVRLRVNAVLEQERVCGRVQVCVPQGNQPTTGRKGQRAFSGFEKRNRA